MAKKDNILSGLQGIEEQEARKLLLAEGKKLERIAIKLWRQYIESYSPKEYVRTGNSERAIKLGAVKRVSPTEFGIELTWENSLVYHDSWLYKKGKTTNNMRGHSVMLISEGWNKNKGKTKLVKALGGRQVHRFTYFEGIDYIGRVREAYNNIKNPLVTLEVQWSGKFVK